MVAVSLYPEAGWPAASSTETLRPNVPLTLTVEGSEAVTASRDGGLTTVIGDDSTGVYPLLLTWITYPEAATFRVRS